VQQIWIRLHVKDLADKITQDRIHMTQTCGKRSNGAALGPPAAVGAGVDGVGVGAGTGVESGGGAAPPIPGITGAISDVFGIP
jgi:hypothetical protein